MKSSVMPKEKVKPPRAEAPPPPPTSEPPPATGSPENRPVVAGILFQPESGEDSPALTPEGVATQLPQVGEYTQPNETTGERLYETYGVKDLMKAMAASAKLSAPEIFGKETPEGYPKIRVPMVTYLVLSMYFPELHNYADEPETIKRSEALDRFVALSMVANDLVDMVYTPTISGDLPPERRDEITQQLQEKAAVYMQDLNENTEIEPRDIDALKVCLNDILSVELWAATNGKSLSFEEMDRYKSLVDGINVVASAISIMGAQRFGRDIPDPSESTIAYNDEAFDEIHQRYAWLLENQPETVDEAKLVSIHRATTAGELMYGRVIHDVNRQLGLQSYKDAAIREMGGHEDLADELLDLHARKMLREAQETGLGTGVAIPLSFVLRNMVGVWEGLYNGSLKYAKRNKDKGPIARLLEKFESKFGVTFERQMNLIHSPN